MAAESVAPADDEEMDEAIATVIPETTSDEIVWENVTEDGLVKKCTKAATTLEPPLYPVDGMELKVHYTGTLPYVEGATEPFDCSRKRKTPFTFTLGHGTRARVRRVASRRFASARAVAAARAIHRRTPRAS